MSHLDHQFLRRYIVARWTTEAMRRHGRAHLSTWLRWCAEQGWVDRSCVGRITWPSVRTDERSIISLSATEARRLLDCLPARWQAAAALGLFAGIRPEELRRVRWEEIDERARVIRITGAASKIREGRTLTGLPANLWAWLACHPGTKAGPIVPTRLRQLQLALTEAKAKAGITTKGSDILRKSFASMAFHLPQGPTWAADVMGHLRGLTMYLRHYRALRTPEESREYFTIMPQKGTLSSSA